jgi:hypothetical protein
MTQARALVVPIHARRGRPDLALALALLGRAVKAHQRVQRLRQGFEALAYQPRPLARCEHAKPMGA